jgi:hypothetical protein
MKKTVCESETQSKQGEERSLQEYLPSLHKREELLQLTGSAPGEMTRAFHRRSHRAKSNQRRRECFHSDTSSFVSRFLM